MLFLNADGMKKHLSSSNVGPFSGNMLKIPRRDRYNKSVLPSKKRRNIYVKDDFGFMPLECNGRPSPSISTLSHAAKTEKRKKVIPLETFFGLLWKRLALWAAVDAANHGLDLFLQQQPLYKHGIKLF
jgi:hypothetical protein